MSTLEKLRLGKASYIEDIFLAMGSRGLNLWGVSAVICVKALYLQGVVLLATEYGMPKGPTRVLYNIR